jgi:hypothetical protein
MAKIRLDALARVLANVVDPLYERIATLERAQGIKGSSPGERPRSAAPVPRVKIRLGSVKLRRGVSVPSHQGSWWSEQTYFRGETVQFGGSKFVATRDSWGERPGTGQSWRCVGRM